MTTATYTDSLLPSSDALFRQIGSEFSAALQSCGLVKTADTGQIDWGTVAKPGTSAVAGYEIFYLNDSLHATAPLYLKLEYGIGVNTNTYAMAVRIGQGSDGAGTLTGQVSSRIFPSLNNTLAYGATSWPSVFCVTEGIAFGIRQLGKCGDMGVCGFLMARTCNADGTINGKGAVIMTIAASFGSGTRGFQQAVAFEAGITYALSGGSTGDAANWFNLPGTATNTDTGGDTQATAAVAPMPRFTAIKGVGCAMTTELPQGSTATIQFFSGESPRTYIQLGTGLAQVGARVNGTDDNLVGLLALWE